MEFEHKIILASASPRRANLLKLLGIDFIVHPLKVEEVTLETPAETTTENARLKAVFASQTFPEKIILAGDTVVDVEGIQIGKPTKGNPAENILQFLSGKTHRVTTTLAIYLPNSQIKTETVESFVTFSRLPETQIESYLKLVETTDKAGAYGIQELGFMLAEKVEGDITNVMGLPLSATFKLFRLAHESGFI